MRSVRGDTNSGHLSGEDLARLVDEAATPEERRHLEACDRCTAELSALSAQTRALSALGDIEPPSGEWDAIESRLGGEVRVIPLRAPERTVTGGGAARRSGWLQAAAGAVLFLAGGATGAGLVSGLPSLTDEAVVPAASPVAAAPDAAVGGDASLSESEALVGLAEDLYMDALLDYRQRVAERDPALVARDPMGRLVMLENLLAATEAAVREAPADPFFNGVLASTTAEHRALVAQMTALSTPTSW